MNNLVVVTLSLIGGGIIGIAIFWFLNKDKKVEEKKDDSGAMLMLQEQLKEIRGTLDNKLAGLDQKFHQSTQDSSRAMRDQFSESAKIIKDVTERLVKLDETNKQVMSFADQLKNLQDILKNPKQRGVLGEYFLETVLKNVLPTGSYQMQYRLGIDKDTGKELVPDAVVFVKDKIIPIDSKFSLENYNRISETSDPAEKERLEKLFVNDLKLRITETAKYIRPTEGTMDFAFMFIPHEAIYYDLLINKIGAITEDTDNLIQRAAGKYKVIIVSPTSFLAYLQTVLQGLKAMQIEETAKDIIKKVGEIGIHLKKYDEYHNRLGSSLGTVVNHFNNSSKEFKKIDKDVLRITGEAIGIEPQLLEKPEEGE